MEKLELKKGLFGYTKQSVLDYIFDVDLLYRQKTEQAEQARQSLEQSIERLKAQVNGFADETDRLVDELTLKDERLAELEKHNAELAVTIEKLTKEKQILCEEIDSLKSELNKSESLPSTSHTANDSSVTDIIFEAKSFASGLKQKAQDEYVAMQNDNLERFRSQKEKALDFAKSIEDLRKSVLSLCESFGGDLYNAEKRMSELSRKSEFCVLEGSSSSAETVGDRMKRLGLG